MAHLVGDAAGTLTCAAWLHDIGYAPTLVVTGFHPLDGARYLRNVAGADELVCRLVAHHSCASIEAANRGLADDLAAEFPPVDGLITDVMTYCDMTTSPDGEPVPVEKRLAEILVRYRPDDVVHRSIAAAQPMIIKSVRTVEAALVG